MRSRHKVLALLPALAMLVALLGVPPLTVSGAPNARAIRAEDWTHREADRSRAGVMVERYANGYRTRTYDSPAYAANFEFNAVASSWEARVYPSSVIRLFVRASRDGVSWSGWSAVAADDDGGTRTGKNFGNLTVLSGSYSQYRLELVGPVDGDLPAVSFLNLTMIDSLQGPEPLGGTGLGVAQAAEAAPTVLSRAQWGADEALRYTSSGDEIWTPEYATPRKAIIHETVTINNDPNPAATVRAIYYYHAVVRGWGDIGYNYLVDGQGNIYEGRAGGPNVVGGHARCYNWGTIGVAALGNYSQVEPSPATVTAIERLLAWKFQEHGIDPQGRGVLGEYAPKDIPNIAGHVDLDGSCGNTHQDPGIYLRRLFPQIRQNVAVRMGDSPQPAPPAQPTPPPPPVVEGGDAAQPPPTQNEPSYKVVRTQKRGLYLRERPAMDGRPLAVVPEGTLVQEETSEIDGWVKTTYNGKKGFLWHGYLQEQPGSRRAEPQPAPVARPLAPGTAAVITGTPGALNLRRGPGMEFEVVSKMWEGLQVQITGEPRGGWYPVTYKDVAGRVLSGWTWGQYLKPPASRAAQTAGAAGLVGALGLPAWGLRRRRRTEALRDQPTTSE